MSYANDVFISYRREKHAWTPWARDTFKQALESCLQRELGCPANVFIDEKIPLGNDYVEYLATTLAKTKVMVALLSRDYFGSDWCVHELDLMMERAGNNNLIIPILVHDGDAIPDEVGKLQRADFKRFANPALSQAGPLYAEFWASISKLAEEIAAAIVASPAYEVKWEEEFKKRLHEVHQASIAGTHIVPKTFALKPSVSPTIPPRLSIGGGS